MDYVNLMTYDIGSYQTDPNSLNIVTYHWEAIQKIRHIIQLYIPHRINSIQFPDNMGSL